MIFSTLLPLAAAASQPVEELCAYDLDVMLALDLQAFDQDKDSGWRALAKRDCDAEAAELIREWRYEKRLHSQILYIHEAQMRANIGQSQEAVELFQLTYKSKDDDEEFGWNYYMDGTIAFIKGDREGLTEAINRLAALPLPTDTRWYKEDGTPIFKQWPANIQVLKAFETCWEEDYKTAYGSPECYKSTD